MYIVLLCYFLLVKVSMLSLEQQGLSGYFTGHFETAETCMCGLFGVFKNLRILTHIGGQLGPSFYNAVHMFSLGV